MQTSWCRASGPVWPLTTTLPRRELATPTMREETDPEKSDFHIQRPSRLQLSPCQWPPCQPEGEKSPGLEPRHRPEVQKPQSLRQGFATRQAFS